MKVHELRLALNGLPDNMEVILQKDGEGNGFSPLRGADSDAIYMEDSPNNPNASSFTLSTEETP